MTMPLKDTFIRNSQVYMINKIIYVSQKQHMIITMIKHCHLTMRGDLVVINMAHDIAR